MREAQSPPPLVMASLGPVVEAEEQAGLGAGFGSGWQFAGVLPGDEVEFTGVPDHLRSDKGPEFEARELFKSSPKKKTSA